jgi:diguanylate cyclase (GGDEF)-like protein
VDSEPLAHAIRNALERSRLLAAARAAAMTDPLTGLLNRSAFQLFADRDRRIAERCASRMAVLVAEPKGFPAPGGEYAEQHRDLLLVEAADQLRAAAGPTDLLARIGDRRFAVSLIETLTESIESAWARFRSSGAPLTIGVAIFNPMHPVSLDALIEQAEADAGASQAAASSA